MQTLVQQRAQLTALIDGGVHTMGTTHTALNNHTDRLVKITGNSRPSWLSWPTPRNTGCPPSSS